MLMILYYRTYRKYTTLGSHHRYS